MLMEPWDGPAALVFTDGTLVGATLDRNGLRPGRYLVTDDGLVVLASEIGVLDIDPAQIVRKGRLRPGKMFLVDTEAGRLIEDDEIKADLAASEPWGDWLETAASTSRTCPSASTSCTPPASVTRRQRTFGYTEEEVRILLAPDGAERRRAARRDGLRHADRRAQRAPAAALRLLHPAVRPGDEPAARLIREEVVTSIKLGLGPERNLLDATPGARPPGRSSTSR